MALEEGLYNASPGGRSSDTVLLECGTQFFVIDKFARGLHGAQQCGLGIVLGRGGPFLGEGRGVGACFSLYERGQRALLHILLLGGGIGGVGIVVCRLVLLGIHLTPSGRENLLAAYLEFYLFFLLPVGVDNLPQYGGGGKLAVGVEDADEACGYEVVYVLLHVGKSGGCYAGRDDGMVVGHFGRVEHLLALGQFLAARLHEPLHQWQVFLHTEGASLAHAVEYLRALGVDVVRQVLGVHTRIGSYFLLVEALYEFEGHVCRIAELLVAVYLQRGEVVEVGWCLASFLLAHIGNGKGLAFNGTEGFLALFLARKLAAGGSKLCVAVDGGQYPVRLRLEMVYLLLAVYDEGKGRCLHAPDAQHLPVLPVLQRVETCGVHAENPVAYGARKSGEVEGLVVALVLQLLESLPYGLVGHGRYPQSLDRTFGSGFLHHPPLYQFTFLPGVTTVDDAVSSLHEAFDGGKLLLDALVVDELDAEALRYHGQGGKAPPFPHGGIVVRLFQFTQVTESPRYLVSVAFHISVACRVGTYDAGNVFGYAGFLCDTNYHVSFLVSGCKDTTK